MLNLEGKVALVTGASSGIGEASAEIFVEQGAKVAVLGRSADEVEQVVERLNRQRADSAIATLADVSKANEMQAAVQQLIDRWGRLDIVLANAGINGLWAPIEELGVEDWDETLNVNLRGTFLTFKYTVPHLKQAGGGSIIVTASVNGSRMFSNTGASAYATSKAGQVAFTKMMALELAPSRVRVNVICPGAIETEIEDNTEREDLDRVRFPVEFPKGKVPLTEGKPGTSRQVAELVLFLASGMSSHITGTEVWIDGAQSLLQG